MTQISFEEELLQRIFNCGSASHTVLENKLLDVYFMMSKL